MGEHKEEAVKRHACDSKMRFVDKYLALRHIDTLARRAKLKGAVGKVQPYRCRFCHYWHIGKSERERNSGSKRNQNSNPR